MSVEQDLPIDTLAGEPRELIESYLAGTLDAEGVARLTAWLKADPAHCRAYAREAAFVEDLGREVRAREERRLHGYASARFTAGGVAPRARWWVAAGLAAAAALLVALNGLTLGGPSAPGMPVVARMASAEGPAAVRRGVAVLPLAVGAGLHADDHVVLSGGGRAEVAFADGTTVALTPGTDFQLVGDQEQKRLYLASGEITVRAAPQPEGRPLLIGTAQAEVTVVGTVFTLSVADGTTRLSVREGLVGMVDRTTRAQHRVAAGERASTGVATAAPAPARTPDPVLGIELGPLGEEGPELAFVDAFRQAAPWRAGGVGGELALDAQRWVRALALGQTAETVMCRGLGGGYPRGAWTCLYDGAGEIEFAGDARVTRRERGRIELTVEPTQAGIVLRLVATDPRDPVRNLRVLMPGSETTHLAQPFHPAFLERWRGAAVIHAADWAERHASEAPLAWEARLRRGGPLPYGVGRPLDDVLDLAAALGSDLWLKAPYQADDGYLSAMAQQVRRRLAPMQRVYLELGGDLWDGQWAPGRYAEAKGRALGIGQIEWYVERSLAMFDLWRREFGDDPRVVRVLSGPIDHPLMTERMLSWKSAATRIDAYAVLTSSGGGLGDGLPVDRLFELGREDALAKARATLAHRRAALPVELARARAHGLRLIGAHSGLGFWPGKVIGQPDWRHYLHVSRFSDDPEVAPLLQQGIAEWNEIVGDLLCLGVPRDRLRDSAASPGTIASSADLLHYQAIAPLLQRQARAKRSP